MAAKMSIINRHPQKLPGPSLLHELVRDNVNNHTPALDYQDEDGARFSTSYRELHAKSDHLARHLYDAREHSGLPRTRHFIVPVFIGQCPELYISQLAILKAGGAFCPITLDVPEDRLRFILKDASATVLVTTSELRTRLPQFDDVTVVAADEILRSSFRERPAVDIVPTMPAYVMYTSGSTGQPKGVLLSHSAATQALLAHDRHIPTFSRFLQFASPTFDVSVFEIFFPLFRGCTLVVCERKRMLNDLPGTINALEVDGAELTPSVANSLLQGRQSVPNLKVLLTIGEMLKQSVVEDFGGSAGEDAILHGMYGPTEATIHCTLQPNFGKDMAVNNIGIPLDTVSALVIRPASADHASHVVEILPIGEEGELAVGGYQLADGYLNREEQTKAAFVSHPDFGPLYRTGDRAKIDSQHRLMCLGRISSGQVKLRGQRIELGEIEYAASRTPGCRDVVADVISDTLVVFCVSSATDLCERHITDTCKKWLPPYMVPNDVLIMNAMPYLASGKVDRRTLQSLHQQFRDSQEPSTDGEMDNETRQLAQVLSEALNYDVLTLSTLSAAGIDSLTSIRIASQLRNHGYPHVNATDLLEARTLSELREKLTKEETSHQMDSLGASLLRDEAVRSVLESHQYLSSQMGKIQDIVRCSPVQSAMLSETTKDPNAYCNWIELQIDVQRNMTDIEQAVRALARQHEMLRTGFAVLDNGLHPYASVIWKEDASCETVQVAEMEYDFSIKNDAQLLRPRPIQLCQSEEGISVLLQLHHSLYDQWSIDVIKEDLDQLLQGHKLSPRPSYSTVSAYHAQLSDQTSSEAETEYWQTHLQDTAVTPLPQLNAKKLPPNLQRTAWVSLDISTHVLREKAKQMDTSAPAIFQAAYAYLLSMYVGASDVMYGSVFSGRHVPVAGVERIVGPCLSTLPSRVDIGGMRTAQDLARAVHNQNRSMIKHSAASLAAVKRIGKYAPNEVIFDTLFVWQESTFAKPLLVTEIDSADKHELNMVLEVEPRDNGVAVRVTYQQSRISAKQVEIFTEQLQCIVQTLINDPQGPLVDVAKALPNHVMAIDNPYPTPHPHQSGLIAALEDVAKRMPSAPALVFGDSLAESKMRFRTLSYSDMHARANRLARHLISEGVKPDDLVCVCLDKSMDLYVTILAVLKAGAGYLPLLPDTPKDRLGSILDQTLPKLFLCDSNLQTDVCSALQIKDIEMSTLDLTEYSSTSLNLPCDGAHAAYSIFTSGSTGTPKGLVVTQDNLLGNLSTLASIYPVSPGDRLLQACSQAFDVSVFEIFFAFFTGMSLCFARKDDLFQDIEHGIRALEVTHLSLTPTVAALVDPKNVPSVHFLVTAGEAMTDVVHRKWAGKGLHQGYGPSETTNICTVNPQMPSSDIISNIGPAFPNTSAFVIDPSKPFSILPFGAVGEFAFGGEQVFRGYIGRDELNAEKIISHPEYGRVYRSGDIGRMLPDGTMLISGRLDDQVKVRGNRIELGEINASLLSHDWVEDCTTMVLGKDAVSQSIATFWIAANSTAHDFEVAKPTGQLKRQVAELYQKLEAYLPPYMIPTSMIPVTTLPRTTQGKLDRRRLEQAGSDVSEDAKRIYFRSAGQIENDEGEWTSTERELAAALQNIVSVPSESLGRSTSFFALGLNSINAIAYAKSLERTLGTVVSVGSILRNASIARLARSLASETVDYMPTVKLAAVFSQATIGAINEKLGARQGDVEAILPCTPLQEAMLSAGASEADATYSNRTTFRVNGNASKLRQCFQVLMERHAILRTSFYETSDPNHPFAQVVFQSTDLPWNEDTSLAIRPGNGESLSTSEVDLQRPFFMAAEAMGNSTVLTLYMHHAIYDGTSMAVLLDEAEKLYRDLELPQAPAFEPFLSEVEKQSRTDAMRFWSSYVKDFYAKPFPLRSDVNESAPAGRIQLPLQTTTTDVDAFSKRHNVSATSIFQAAWAKVLTMTQLADDVCFGDVVSGRSVPVAGVDRLVAPCFNTLPVRISFNDIYDNVGLVRKLHSQRFAADPYQLSPLRRIQTLSKTPDVHLFDSLLLVQTPTQELDKDIWEMREDEGLMDLPLVIEIVQGLERSELVVHFSSKYLSQENANALATAFIKSMADCLQYPSGNARDASVTGDQLKGLLETQLVSEAPSDMNDDGTSPEKWTAHEELIRRAFSHFGNVESSKIRRHTSLYRLGLDSLNAVQVASRLRSDGMSITAADVMEHRTPAALAAAAASVRSTACQADEISKTDLAKYDHDHRSKILQSLKISSASLESIRPCTPAQNGMIAQSLQTRGALYVNHIVYRVPHSINVEDIRSAWQAVQRKHQALRMGFLETEEASCPFAMVIYRNGEVALPIQDGTSTKTDTSVAVVETLHLPTWRVMIDRTSDGHNMILSIHHALYDAESLQLLLRDFGLATQRKDIGSPSSIDDLLHPMIEGANTVDGKAEEFWRKALTNTSPAPFPNLHPTISTASDLYSVETPSSLSYSALESLCKQQGCTIQAAGQTAWAMVLSAYLGEAGVTFGTVFSGRTGSQQDSVVFPSLTTVPVFCNTSKDASEVLSDMTNFNGAAQRYRHVPLSDLQRIANLPGQALFDTVFVYQKSTEGASDNLSWPLLKQSAAVDYNVSIELEATQTGEMSLRLTANSGVVPEEHASLLLAQYDHLLKDILQAQTASQGSLGELYSVTAPQCPTLPSPVQLLHQFVEEGARLFPDKPALEFAWSLDSSPKSRKVWSYQQLDERANQVAQLLHANGATSGNIVAVCMDKCPEASFAFVGILKAGCAFLALDPELPLARKQFILQDSGAAVLLVDDARGVEDDNCSSKVLKLDTKELDAFPTSPVRVAEIDPQATCYCLYTSGTTGTPKGCELTHENAVQAMMSFQKLFAGRWDERSRWLQFASYWFDVSVLEQFWSWSVGITMVGAPRDLVLDDITLFIQKMHITHIDLTPSLARILEPEDVPSLWDGVFITGGEALKQEIIEKWGTHKTICNGYGPTEATIGVTMNPFIGADAKASNIGPAFLNVGSYVFEPGTTTPVLRGAVGELCVSGKLVGKGYLNRPELTAKAFPILEETGEKVYRTGDLVRQVADGSFLFIGRQDSQTKLRGQRLEIDEIDSVIKSSSDNIADYASLVIKSGDKETLVTFFITEVRKQAPDVLLETSEQARTAAHAAYESCRSHLPGYMVPTHILPLNIIPLTVNNKIDAKRLNAFYNGLSISDLQEVIGLQSEKKPLDGDAKKICKVLERMLSVDISQIDNSTNIFSLGLSSVSAITFATLLKRAGFSGANVALVMRNPVIGQLTDALTKSIDASQDEDSVRQAQMNMAAFDRRYRALAASKLGVKFENIEVVAPCTPLQQGLIVESVKGEEHPYFNEFKFVVDQLDLTRLQNAFQQVVDGVQSLRTKFMQTDDGYAQIVLQRQNVLWHENFNIQELDAEATKQRSQWLERNSSDLRSPFEIALIRSQTTSIIVVYIHHALYDGVSFDMVMDRVSAAYSGQTVECGPKFIDALPYGPLRKNRDADAFWKSRLGSVTDGRLSLITDDSAGADPVETHTFDSGASLDAICRKLGVSHQAVTQACFSVALNQIAPSINTYGVVVSGRSFSFDGADEVLGPLFNMIPNTSGLQTNDTWASLVHRCQASSAASLPYQHTPLRDIKKWCKFAPLDPVFDVIFVSQNLSAGEKSDESTIWKPLSDGPKAEYPLAFELERNASGELTATIVARRNHATAPALRKIVHSFDQALQLLDQDPEQPIAKDFEITAASAINRTPENNVAQDVPYLNGVHDFSWTAEAQKLRSEIASIASLEEDDVDEHSTIFALGLDSIDAVKLASRLKKNGLLISVSKLLKAQTIPRMIDSLQQDVKDSTAKDNTSLFERLEQQLPTSVSLPESFDRSQIERILSATPSQEALVAEMVRSDFLDYYNHDVLQLKPEIGFDRLRDAWETVVRHSPILRTAFVEVSSPDIDVVYAQIVHKFGGIDLACITLEDISELDGVLNGVRDTVRQASPGSPPTKLTFVEVASERYLVLSLAHAQYDGHSLALMHEDVKRAYYDLQIAGRPLPDSVIEGSLTAVDGPALAFWRDNLSGAQISRLPKANLHGKSSILHRVETTSAVTAYEARSFCRGGGHSMQSLAQTSWALTLAHYVNRLEVIFGAVLACRDSEEAEQILFPMMNTVPIRAMLHGSRREMLRHMQDVGTDVLTYQRTPLRHIQRVTADVVHLDEQNEASDTNALFDALFIYQHRPDQDDHEAETLYDSVGGSSNIEYPVAVEVEAVGECLILRAACKDNFFDHKGAEGLLQTLDHVLQAIVRSPEDPTVAFKGSQASICGLPFTDVRIGNIAGATKDEGDRHEDECLPSSTEATTIRDALCQVSRTPPEELSPSSTIESIGIDSISAIKVVSLLRKQGVKLSVGELIRAKTLGRMARVVQDRAADPASGLTDAKDTVTRYIEDNHLRDVPALQQMDDNNVQTILPALPGQVYMLNVWQATKGQLFYPTFTYRFTGHASVDQLRGAWQALVGKHAILRTVFCATNNAHSPMCQVVLKETPESFSSGEDQPPNSSQQPMARLNVRKIASAWTLQLAVHHALYDAVSLPLLLEDLASLITGSSPTTSPVSQADFLALFLTSSAQSSRKAFWTDYLKNAKPIGLKQPDSHHATPRVEIFTPGLLSAESTLEAVARRESLTPQSILFAAHAKAYAKTAARLQTASPSHEDVVIGIYLSNRSHIEHLPTLRSPTLNLVPLLVRSAGTTPLLESAKHIQHDLQSIGSPENSAVGLWEIAEWTGVKVDTFVNFLRLPGTTDETDQDGATTQARVELVEDERLASRSRVTDAVDVDFCPPNELLSTQQNVGDAYLHSLDLEATITPEGTLDVGLFCPAAIIKLPEAEAMLQDLKYELQSVGA